jgi:hypothetical protein
MVVYHVTTWKKINRYMTTGAILPPVRAWKTIEAAERFSKQTGRKMILRLTFPDAEAKPYEGHRGEAVYLDRPYVLDSV